ncbi:MAG: replication protein [Candidatus Subteraquimicrobiales bacterium]|nr:replication protein [Candidatus Subteraquimicrobiales bacterium]
MQKKDKEKDIDFHFHGFSRPKYTQVPDDLFDFLLPFLDEKELKVLLYVIRRTLGWKKDSDMISLNQLEKGGEKDKGCGLKKRTIIRALQSLEEKKCIHIERAKASDGINLINSYSLNFKGEGGWCHARHYGSVSAGMGGSVPADTQQHTCINTNTTTVVVDFSKF